MPRPKLKTEVSTLKLTPEVRAAWVAAATRKRRALANMFEVAIVAYCEQHRIVAPFMPGPELATDSPKPTKSASM